MIDFILQPNVITGLIAGALSVLMMVAFRGYALTWSNRTVDHLGAALFWLATQALGRAVWWDLFGGFGLGETANWFWNLMAIYACYHALKGFYLLIPVNERARYNILTAPFYPRNLWRSLRDRGDASQ